MRISPEAIAISAITALAIIYAHERNIVDLQIDARLRLGALKVDISNTKPATKAEDLRKIQEAQPVPIYIPGNTSSPTYTSPNPYSPTNYLPNSSDAWTTYTPAASTAWYSNYNLIPESFAWENSVNTYPDNTTSGNPANQNLDPK
jgi:hypothetical protein